MRRKILALTAALAIGAATMTTSAMAFRGGFGGHGMGMGGHGMGMGGHGLGMGGGHATRMGGGAHWGGMHHFARFDRDDRFRRFSRFDRDDFRFRRFHHFARFDRDDFRFRHFHRHFFLAAGPGFSGGPCWRPVWTPWGRRWRRVC
jgi:hypothetical protein